MRESFRRVPRNLPQEIHTLCFHHQQDLLSSLLDWKRLRANRMPWLHLPPGPMAQNGTEAREGRLRDMTSILQYPIADLQSKYGHFEQLPRLLPPRGCRYPRLEVEYSLLLSAYRKLKVNP